MAPPPQAAIDGPRTRGRRTLLATLLALGLLAAGGGAYYVLGATPARAAAPKPPRKPLFVGVEALTVNLQSEGKPRFLHLGLSLKVNDEASRDRVAQAMPELRSRLLLLLSNRDPAALATPADKARLAEEIRTELNRPIGAGLPPQDIAAVGFSAFVVQ